MKTQRIWGTLDPFHESGPILGRKVANTGFLNGLLSLDPFDEYHFFLSGAGLRKGLHSFFSSHYPAFLEQGRVKIMDRRDLPDEIASREYFCFHQSDCINYPPHLARVRNRYAKNIFPITATTHSLSYSSYPSFFLNYLWPGTTGRDCIVTTSTAGKLVVEKYFRHLREGLCLSETTHPSPQIKRIPLGVNPEESSLPEEHRKAQAKRNLGMDGADERVNILVFGRIAHYSKMDILPLLRAMQRLFSSGLSRDRVRIMLAGWLDDDDDFPATLSQLAKNMGVELSIIGRPSDERKTDLYRAADIFVSISDNPQETFGLTVLEAGAAGLPVIASDYDGYKDLVVNNETGMLIETIGPEATPELDLMAPLCFDNHYHLLMAQQTAVDTPKLAGALEKLINDPQLRANMGRAGANRVRENFSWSKVIEEHLSLWEELNNVPVESGKLRETLHPTQLRLGETFSHYPTETLAPETKLVCGTTGQAIYQGREFPLMYKGVDRFLNDEVVRKIPFLARKPLDAAELAEKMKSMAGNMDDRDCEFHILWCLKHDVLEKIC
ncbi:glycosyltransferase family 4 protein [Desulfovibrio sp. JC010]|uniref:glycosyltransferase family 4 protein n=1 Tax=Desulfovibrio sp. JC010 TaxID=2593641 RepID=UPI0013D88801|nr:glycosyltransferase family 4 protein [Desulfovibrio sp. JC010]NDV26324.1 glycosyltransferase family 4 protein [Desulfovibrio sp. JC010]